MQTVNCMNKERFLSNIDKVYTTEMDVNRIKIILKIYVKGIEEYCKNKYSYSICRK